VARRADLITAGLAVMIHAGLAFAVVRNGGPARPRSRPIEVDFPRPPPAPVAVAPLEAPPPPRVRPARAARHAQAGRAAAVSAAPRLDPPPAAPPPSPSPLFGVSMDSPTAADSPVSAPVGGSTVADPARASRARTHAPGGPPGGLGGDGAAPELEIKVMPEIDTDACGKSVSYPADAETSGVEGDVRLRVSLDERGHVRAARVLSGLGHGLDQAAVEALTRHCRFTPAIATNGRPVAFVIESYTFHFQLPR
jgi:protein TonB